MEEGAFLRVGEGPFSATTSILSGFWGMLGLSGTDLGFTNFIELQQMQRQLMSKLEMLLQILESLLLQDMMSIPGLMCHRSWPIPRCSN